MTHTLQEARVLWCPFAKTTTTSDGTIYDTRGDSFGFVSCVAAGCMAWRWADAEYEKSMSPERPDGEGWELSDRPATGKWQRPVINRRGYCGLAGPART